MTHKAHDNLIIGGGVIGLTIAWHLSKQGQTVMVLDSSEPGQASAAAAGMLAPLAEAKEPGPFLDLALDSLHRYPDYVSALREDSGAELDISGPGMLRAARTDEEEVALCRAMEWQDSLGLPLHRLTGEEVRRLEPAAAPTIQAAILSPAERHIEPRLLLSALTAACRRYGVQFRHGRITGFTAASGRVAAAKTETECFPCGQLILCSGAWSRTLGKLLSLHLPVTPLRGQMLDFGPVQPYPIRHTLYTHGAYLVPRADGRIVVGATEEWAGFAAHTTDSGLAGLHADAAGLLAFLADQPLQSAWAGLRPVSADGLPLLGRAPGWDNVHIAAGHGRNGILLAPVTGVLMANAILNSVPLPAAFNPARFRETR